MKNLNENQRMQQLAGLLKENENSEVSEKITYIIWGEGPTFTNSQMGGHGFFDWDLYDLIRTGGYNNHKVTVKNGKLIMVTEFDINDYFNDDFNGDYTVTKEQFDNWWKQNNKNGIITDPESDELPWNSTLTNKNDKWYLIDSGDLKEILDNNDSTSDDKKELLLKNPNIGLYDYSKSKNIEVKDENQFTEEFKANQNDEGLGLLLGDLYNYVDEYFVKSSNLDDYLEEFEDEAPKYKEIWNNLPSQFTIIPENEYDNGPMNIEKTENGFKTDFWNK